MKKEQTQTKRNHQSKEEEATRQETKRKKQQAQTERSHRRKEEEATRNRFMGGVLRGKYKRQEEGKGTKRKHQHQKNRKPHLQGGFKEASTQGLQTQTRRKHQTKEKDTTRNRLARVFTRSRCMEGSATERK